MTTPDQDQPAWHERCVCCGLDARDSHGGGCEICIARGCQACFGRGHHEDLPMEYEV